ncbi:deaminase [Chryseobacterium aureum]|uniref:deaminase n=1 Tax=Chryseobacterium aureum TaxID=2497456 RepID=UPI000F85C271|nr:deaminase [Chryseobacterium aureum]
MKTENPNLKFYLDKKVEQLIVPEDYKLEEGAKERHRLFSLLLMSITKYYWNSNKNGKDGKYPFNPVNYGKFENNDYYGHNIASLAVDAYGEVIDFEFNHNNIFSSTTEHAEARMVKRVFSLTQINDSWKVSLEKNENENENEKNKHTFEDVVLYTTLESCSQCAGVMALARVKEIVYLQTDPGMYLIGNILRNLTRTIENVPNTGGLISPMPITGLELDLTYFEQLNTAYKIFQQKVEKTPFFEPNNPQNKKDFSPSITSFLCTDLAYQIYKDASNEFEHLTEESLKFVDYKPKDKNGIEIMNAKTNKSVLAEVKDFYQYAIKKGKRGTPHK